MNISKRVFFTWDERMVAFNTFQEGTDYLRKKFGVVLKDVPEGWYGEDSNGVPHWLMSTIIYYNDGNMIYD